MRSPLVLAAALVALAAPAAATAAPRRAYGSVLGGDLPLRAYASIAPPVQLFADAITARVAVVADTEWIDPRRLEVRARFAPYEPVRPPTVLHLGSGRFLQITWTWTLRCLTGGCVPRTPPSDRARVFRFPPARIDYLAAQPARRFAIRAAFPAVEVVSELSPGVVSYLAEHRALDWQAPVTPLAAPGYRVSPDLVFPLALALAGLAALAGLGLAARLALAFRRPAPLEEAVDVPASTLGRALALLDRACERGDETLRRKALARVADELPDEAGDLAAAARALAWSPAPPADDDVRALAERARARSEADG